MDKLISEKKAIEAINDYWGEMETPTIDGYINAIKGIPSAEPKTGHWRPIYQGDEIINYRCSECEFGSTFGKSTHGMNYCPNCGAKMN